MSAYLVLSDGQIFEGKPLGAAGVTCGEVVFNTGMTGYQEILTDPSYAGQIVLFTYPMIGNYGINEDDFESDRVQPSGIIVREACDSPSNWRSTKTLHSFLVEHGVTSIQDLDTRAIAKRIREAGVTMGCITHGDVASAQEALSNAQAYGDTDFVLSVTTKAPYAWGYAGREPIESDASGYRARIVAVDFGLKHNILRRFAALGVRTVVLPATSTASEILAWNPDGILLSPGPGDPARLGFAVQTVRELLGKKPLFGICLGNQLLCHALGGSTYKLRFGHRGSNHPVKDLLDNTVTITSQNHGYAVDAESLTGKDVEITQLNLNDNTVEGIRSVELQATSIQYHPEAAPGPWDSRKYFNQFLEQIEKH